MDTGKLNDKAIIEVTNQICDGIKKFIKNNPDNAGIILDLLVDEVCEPLNGDDFWGTEGWEHTFGIED
jgi:hypothetical protein